MKQIEELENLGWEELELSALQDPAPVPEGLKERITASLAADTRELRDEVAALCGYSSWSSVHRLLKG